MAEPFYKIKLVSAVGIRFMDRDGIVSIAKKYTPYSDSRYGFNEEFQVNVIFRDADFLYLKELNESENRFDDVKVIIYTRCGGVYTEKSRAIIKSGSVKYNYDSCTAVIELLPNTRYNKYDDVKGQESNAFDLTNVRTAVRVSYPSLSTPTITVQNGVPLYNVLSELLRVNMSASLKSDFFQWNSSDPGYVVGNSDKIRRLTLYQRSDITRALISGYTPATIMMVSIEDIVDDLCAMFNLRYVIDSGNNFIIEHVSWFAAGPTVDLIVPRYAKYLVATNKFTFDRNEIFKREKYTIPDPTNAMPYAKGTIEYNNSFVRNSPDTVSEQQEIVVKKLSPIVTGLFYLDPEDIDASSGITIIAIRADGFIQVDTGDYQENDVMFWPKLLNNFYLHERTFSSGLVNGIETNFLSTKRIKLQNTIKIPVCCNESINPFSHFITSMGEGVLKSMTIDEAAGLAELSLLYTFDGSNVLDVPEPVADFYATAINTGFDTIAAGKPSLLANDINAFSADTETKTTAMGGSVAIRGDGNFAYTPPLGLHGGDSFEYTALSLTHRAAIGFARVVVKTGTVYLHVEDRSTSQTIYPGSGVLYTYRKVGVFYEDPLLLVPLDVTGYEIFVTSTANYGGTITTRTVEAVGFEISLLNHLSTAAVTPVTATVATNPDFIIV